MLTLEVLSNLSYHCNLIIVKEMLKGTRKVLYFEETCLQKVKVDITGIHEPIVDLNIKCMGKLDIQPWTAGISLIKIFSNSNSVIHVSYGGKSIHCF